MVIPLDQPVPNGTVPAPIATPSRSSGRGPVSAPTARHRRSAAAGTAIRLSHPGRALSGLVVGATTAAVERPSDAITVLQAAGDDASGLPDGVPQHIRALRRELGVSTAALAAGVVEVARTTAWEWEVGHRPIPSARQASLAALLRVAPACSLHGPRRLRA